VILRRASSMIELVIAIVVMGIAITALPLMLTRTQENNTFSMQQEAILAARTQIGDILTYPWDENSANNGYVLDTNSTNNNFERNSTVRRVGHVVGNKRRKYSPTTLYADPTLGIEGSDYNDIDDFNSATVREVEETNGSTITGLDYKFDFNMTTTVSYVSDTLTSPFILEAPSSIAGITTNIKMIELHTQGDGINFKLRAYSANIGNGELLRRDF